MDSLITNSKATYSLLAYDVNKTFATEVFTVRSKNNFVISSIYNNIVNDSYICAIKALAKLLAPHNELQDVNIYYLIDNTIIYQTIVPRIQAVAALFCEIEYIHNIPVFISKNRMLKITEFNRLITPQNNVRRFKLESYHLKLFKQLRIKWNNLLNGNPIVNTEIPYFTTDIAKDIAEILDLNSTLEETKAFAMRIHNEMDTVVEIINSSTTFEEGIYEFDETLKKWFKLSEILSL